MPAHFAYPVPLRFPVAGQVGYCFEFYSVDDDGTIKPDGWYDFTTTGRTKTWDFAKCLKPVYRRSSDTASADGKVAMLPIPQKVLAYPNVMAMVYTVADDNKRDLVTILDRTTMLRIVGG